MDPTASDSCRVASLTRHHRLASLPPLLLSRAGDFKNLEQPPVSNFGAELAKKKNSTFGGRTCSGCSASASSATSRLAYRNSSSTRERWLANARSISDRDVRLAGARFRTAASASHATCGGLYFIFSIFLLRVNTKGVAPVRAMLLYESRNLMR